MVWRSDALTPRMRVSIILFVAANQERRRLLFKRQRLIFDLDNTLKAIDAQQVASLRESAVQQTDLSLLARNAQNATEKLTDQLARTQRDLDDLNTTVLTSLRAQRAELEATLATAKTASKELRETHDAHFREEQRLLETRYPLLTTAGWFNSTALSEALRVHYAKDIAPFVLGLYNALPLTTVGCLLEVVPSVDDAPAPPTSPPTRPMMKGS